ncbi:MAG: hypothetical protein ACI4TW_08495 [Prevotella sp.]
MVGNTVGEELRRYEADMLQNYKREIKSCIPGNGFTFSMSVIAGVVSAFLFAVIAGVFYFVGETSDRSSKEKVENMVESVQHTIPSKTDSIQ